MARFEVSITKKNGNYIATIYKGNSTYTIPCYTLAGAWYAVYKFGK